MIDAKEFEALVAGYIEERLDPGERARLDGLIVAEPALARTFAMLTAYDSLLFNLYHGQEVPASDAARARTPRHPAARRRLERARPIRWGAWMALVAACLAIIAGSLVYNHYRSTQFADVLVARIQETSPNVKIIRAGETVFALVDMPLYADDRMITGGGGGARFAYEGERTEVRIDRDTTLDIGGVEAGKRLRLERGVLDATVAPQPAGRLMAITTPHAKAEVVGTRFSLNAGKRSTRLDVPAGTVRLTRLSDGLNVTVPDGHYVVAGPDVPLEVLPIDPISASVNTPVLPGDAQYVDGPIIFREDFENIPLDDMSSLWSVNGGNWEVVASGDAAGTASVRRARVEDVERSGKVSRCLRLDPAGEPSLLIILKISDAATAERVRRAVERHAFAVDFDHVLFEDPGMFPRGLGESSSVRVGPGLPPGVTSHLEYLSPREPALSIAAVEKGLTFPCRVTGTPFRGEDGRMGIRQQTYNKGVLHRSTTVPEIVPVIYIEVMEPYRIDNFTVRELIPAGTP